MKNIIVYGSSTFGQILKPLVIACGHRFIGYIDDYDAESPERLGSFQDVAATYPPDEYEIVIGIGYTRMIERWEIYQQVRQAGYRVPKLVHPKAMVAEDALIGDGAVIMMGAIADIRSQIGELTVMWPGAVVSHDSVVKESTFIGSNVTVCGFVQVGKCCFIGVNAMIINHNTVPDFSFVKAGRLFYSAESTEHFAYARQIHPVGREEYD